MGPLVGVPDVTCQHHCNGFYCDRPRKHTGLHREGRWRWDDESAIAEQMYRDSYPYSSKDRRCDSRHDGLQCVMKLGHRCQHGNGRVQWRTDPRRATARSSYLDRYGKPRVEVKLFCGEYPAGLHGDSKFACQRPIGHAGPHKTHDGVYRWTNEDGYLREVAAGRLPPNRRCSARHSAHGRCALISNHGGPHMASGSAWTHDVGVGDVPTPHRSSTLGEWKTIEFTIPWAPDDTVEAVRDHLLLTGSGIDFHTTPPVDHSVTVKLSGYEADLDRWRKSLSARRRRVAKLGTDG